jgi:ech hydrogenase subunit C
VLGGIDKVLPVDVFVPGCCPRPEAIIDGIMMAAGKLDEKAELMKKASKQEASVEMNSGSDTPDGGNA